LPGVGAFQEAIKNLKPLSNLVLEKILDGTALLGICLGLQLLFSTSTEGGLHEGLDFFKGKVIKSPPNVKIPHIGWNTLKIVDPNSPLFQDVPNGAYVYFVHSFYASPENVDAIISKTFYGLDFPSTLARKNVFLTQFHPEKSAAVGLQILKNFVDYVKT
jgi:glutamine amidotransferase